ncbi:MAG: helix-turn-helix domain-containing protein [Chloroflexota bacterium]|nr:helix-turn-helix domain-containing protein [Chloroflexota bacterium]
MRRATARTQAEIGAALRNARLAQGITQDELAQAPGVDRVTISRYEGGKRAIALPTLMDVSAYLGVPLALLLPAVDRGNGTETSRLKADLAHNVHVIVTQLCRHPDLIGVVKAVVTRASLDRSWPKRAVALAV